MAETWAAMEGLVRAGLTSHIGVCNVGHRGARTLSPNPYPNPSPNPNPDHDPKPKPKPRPKPKPKPKP